MKNSSDAEFIAMCARKGFSKSHTAQLMGLTPENLKAAIDIFCLQHIEWAGPGKSCLAKKALKELHASQVGKTHNWLTENDRQKLRTAMKAKAPIYEAFGQKGTLPDLVERFGVVHINSVYHRLKRGIPLEQALTTPRSDGVAQNSHSHPWRLDSEQGFRNHTAKRQHIAEGRRA